MRLAEKELELKLHQASPTQPNGTSKIIKVFIQAHSVHA